MRSLQEFLIEAISMDNIWSKSDELKFEKRLDQIVKKEFGRYSASSGFEEEIFDDKEIVCWKIEYNAPFDTDAAKFMKDKFGITKEWKRDQSTEDAEIINIDYLTKLGLYLPEGAICLGKRYENKILIIVAFVNNI